jgi:hypothetical protein
VTVLPQLHKLIKLDGDTYSSAEVMGLVRRTAEELERVRGELLACQNTNIWHIRCKMAEDDNVRLRGWIRRIDSVNDNPARFMTDIDDYCRSALSGEPLP